MFGRRRQEQPSRMLCRSYGHKPHRAKGKTDPRINDLSILKSVPPPGTANSKEIY